MNKTFDSYTSELRTKYAITQGTEMAEFHAHDHYEIKVCPKCHMTAIYNGEMVSTSKPCITVYKPFTLHWEKHDSDTLYERYTLYFQESYLAPFESTGFSLSSFDENGWIFEPDEQAVAHIVAYIRMLLEEADKDVRQALLFAVLRLIYNETVGKTAVHTSPAEQDYILNVMKQIGENIGHKQLAEELATRHFISVSKLRYDFKEFTHETLGDYIDFVRTVTAKRMLSDGVRVADVAEACGYTGANSFIRFFKEKTGVTPSKYAESVWQMRKNDAE